MRRFASLKPSNYINLNYRLLELKPAKTILVALHLKLVNFVRPKYQFRLAGANEFERR